MKNFFFTLLLYGFVHQIASAKIIYVDAARPDNNGDGLSWATAKKDIQNALDMVTILDYSSPLDQIWIKAGTYYPTVGPILKLKHALRTYTNCEIYGGFVGNETNLSQRNPSINQTVISGDFDNDSYAGTITNDAYHLLYLNGSPDKKYIVDGLFFQFSYGEWEGGALVVDSNVDINYCTFRYNNAIYPNTLGKGGAISGSGVNINLNNCTFLSNKSSDWGGAIHCKKKKRGLMILIIDIN